MMKTEKVFGPTSKNSLSFISTHYQYKYIIICNNDRFVRHIILSKKSTFIALLIFAVHNLCEKYSVEIISSYWNKCDTKTDRKVGRAINMLKTNPH